MLKIEDETYPDGSLRIRTFLDYKTYKHRRSGPAQIAWFKSGELKYESYYEHGVPHREGGPARVGWAECGSKIYEVYLVNGKLHRENGPAKIYWDIDGSRTYEEYAKEGEAHRADGPAKVWLGSEGPWKKQYWLRGEKVPATEVIPVEFPKVHIMPDTRPNKQSMLF